MLPLIKTRVVHATLLLAIFALMAGGCASRESKLIGQWKVDKTPPTGDRPMSLTRDQAMAMDSAQKMFGNSTFDLKQDKTFAMSMMTEIAGDWELDAGSNTVTLNATRVAGVDISKMPKAGKNQKPIILNISSDNRTLTLPMPVGLAGSGGDINFVKAR